MGRPIAQSPLHATRRVGGDPSLYAKAGDAVEFAGRIVDELLHDPRRAALGQATHKRSVPDLLWPQQVPARLKAADAALGLAR